MFSLGIPAGIAAPASFITAWVTEGALTSGYSPVQDHIGDVAAIGTRSSPESATSGPTRRVGSPKGPQSCFLMPVWVASGRDPGMGGRSGARRGMGRSADDPTLYA